MEGPHYAVTASATIHSDPKRVYGIIANYRTEHGRILPDEFANLTVERGGIGEGTLIWFEMKAFGRRQQYRAAVTEPVPGRILVETDLETNGAVTTFIVEDGPSAGKSRVTIRTELESRAGLSGAIERRLASLYLSRVYRKELARLDAYAARGAAAAA